MMEYVREAAGPLHLQSPFFVDIKQHQKKKKERKRTTFFFVRLRHVKTKDKKELSQVAMNAQKNVVFQDRSTFHAIARFYF